MANYSRWNDIKKQRPAVDAETRTGVEQDLALALASRPHVLLLDEPTNHLSIALVDELTEALDGTGAAVVIITHDRQLRRDLAAWPQIALGNRTAGSRR